MNSELTSYASAYEKEIIGYRDNSTLAFVQQYVTSEADQDSDLTSMVFDYFSYLDMAQYQTADEQYSYYEICLGFG